MKRGVGAVVEELSIKTADGKSFRYFEGGTEVDDAPTDENDDDGLGSRGRRCGSGSLGGDRTMAS
jgi:hypothetical protein